MLEKIISIDKELFVFLNGLGSENFDSLWLIITKQSSWIPLFVFLLYLVYKKLGTKQTIIIVLFVAVLLTVNNTITELFKSTFQRLRPCNDPEIKDIIRIVKTSSTFSFFSGHSSNTMAVFVFLYSIFRKKYKYFWLLILWPLIFAYSRIYLGLHFPTDILAGYTCGIITGCVTYIIYQIIQLKYFKDNF
ncbi:MAG: phosphatase PAP2 family protein [Flavobacterium sp.]|uniref:phosphatase PAP2 family protein n=1 Tax=Flavobacterium sp. TaxID=239 RepID=UPI0032632CE0